MRLIRLLLFLLLLSIVPLSLWSQQVNTLYFMEDIPVRHFLNPSFQPTTDYYLSLPLVGFTQFNVGNNSLSLKDIIYNVNEPATVSFLNSPGNIMSFYNTLKSDILIKANFQTNLLSAGFRHESAYWTFTVIEKIDGTMDLPKSVFNITLFGTPKTQNNFFNFTSLQGDISAYTEVALGYSKRLENKWQIGGKLKLLLGSANMSNNNNQFLLKAGGGNWTLNGSGIANLSSPVHVNVGADYQSTTYSMPTNISDWIKPSGIGAGIDLGCEYRLNNNIKLSCAINDLGFIHWSRNTLNYQYVANYNVGGIESFNSNSGINTLPDVYNQLILNNALKDSVVKALKPPQALVRTSNSYTTTTTAKINIGCEYSFLNDKLSFGVLSYSQLFKSALAEEFTGSVNARPFNWLNASLSYSFFNGRMSTLGAGLGLRTGCIYWFFAADYIPLEKTALPLSDLGVNYSKINIPIPYNSRCFNVSAGINLVFDKKDNKATRGLSHTNKKQKCNCEWN